MSSSRNQPGKQKAVWQNLLKVPSKEVMVKLCNQAILYKGLTSDVLPDSVVAEWSSSLSITKGETRQVIVSLAGLLQRAVFAFASEPSAALSTMPEDMQKELQELLCSILAKRFHEWKHTLEESNVTLPRLVDVQCRVDGAPENTALDMTHGQSNCILQLKIEDVTKAETTKLVDVQLSREKLNTMLDGLSKIRDQLSSVTQR